jgi:hypothetical protein
MTKEEERAYVKNFYQQIEHNRVESEHWKYNNWLYKEITFNPNGETAKQFELKLIKFKPLTEHY